MSKSFFLFGKGGNGSGNANTSPPKQQEHDEESAKPEEFRTFLASAPGAGIRAEVERLESECASAQRTYPFSADTGLERAVLQLLHSEPLKSTLPVQLLILLFERFSAGCGELEEREFAHFLQDSLPAMYALVALSPSTTSPVLLDLGMNEKMLVVIHFFCSKLLRKSAMDMMVAVAPKSGAKIPSAEERSDPLEGKLERDSGDVLQSSSLSRDVVVRILSDAVRLLFVVLFRSAPPEINIRGITASILARGLACHGSGHVSTRSLAVPKEKVFLADTAFGVISSRSRSVFEAYETIFTRCIHLFLYLSKDTVDVNVLDDTGKGEEEMDTEVLCFLAFLMLNGCREQNEEMVRELLIGMCAQFARFLQTEEQRMLDLILRQMSCSLLLVTAFLRDFPLLTIDLMSRVDFFQSLMKVLRAVGGQYKCALGDADYAQTRKDSLKELQEITNMETFRTRRLSENVLCLAKPQFGRLADNDCADEFLHGYLGLLEAQRHAKTLAEAEGVDSASLRLFTEIELTIMRTFLDSPKALFPDSCMYDTLMKFVFSCLPSRGMMMREEHHVGALMPLLNAGLCHTLFHHAAFRTLRDDPRLKYASVYLLHYMLTRPLTSLEESIEVEVGIIFDVFCTNGENRRLHEERIDDISLMCAILISAVHVPNTTPILSTILQRNGVSLFLETANSLSLLDTTEREVESNVGEWVMYLLTVLLRQPEVQQDVLMNQTSVVFSLFAVKGLRKEASEMIISLLSHRCSEAEYPQRMALFVKGIWGLIAQCLRVETDGSVSAVLIRADDESHLFLSLLYCIRVSICSFNADVFSWGPVRQLQNVLCDTPTGIPGPFFCLLHRAALPWHGVKTSDGLSSLLQTIALLVHGNPALRARLFQTIDAEKLVECFRDAWFTSHGRGSWMKFVRSILTLVYEEDGDLLEMDRHNNISSGSSSSNNCHHHHSNVGKSLGVKRTSNAVSYLPEGNEHDAIQNPEILISLLGIFAKLKEFNKKHRDALEYLLLRIVQTLKTSRVSLWMAANAGLFVSLTALIPVVTGTALLETVQSLIVDIACHHISVRETKQFLISIAHTENEEARRRFVPIVIDVLNCAARVFLNSQRERRSYIAFRERSGLTGVRATLQDFPQDGYTVSMWVRMERCAARRMPQCLFSLQGVERRTVLELVITVRGIFVRFQDGQKKTSEMDLNCEMTPEKWSHLAVVHYQTTLPFRKSKFSLFLDGEECMTVASVQYPELSYGVFYIGTRGENVEQHSSGGSFAGQMASVYFFSRPLSAKEVKDFSDVVMNVSSLKQYASHVNVHVDSRFGERGQLHNLAALMRGKSLERPLVTYEGTVACNTNNIVDSICVIGALQTVVVPLLLLLVTPQLPFQCRVPVAKRKAVPETTRKAMDHLLQLVESLLVIDIVRADVQEVGLFPMISHVLQQFVGYDCENLPQRLWSLCMALLSSDTIFDAAYTSLFLSEKLLQACSEKTQLVFIKMQHTMIKKNSELRQRVRHLDLSGFVVREIVCVYNTFSTHHQAMRLELFTLLDTIMVDPITANDADALVRLIVTTLEQEEQENSPLLLEILRCTRVLVAKKSLQLAVYMGRKNFVFVLISILQNVSTAVRNEALLFLCLLVSRSRWTQELLNPTLLTTHGAVHVVGGVSLSWLRDKLQSTQVDMTLYETLRAALTGRFDVSLGESIGLRGDDKIVFVPALTPLLQLMNRCQDESMKLGAMMDLAMLVEQDSSAWKTIVSVPGWYTGIVDLYLLDDHSGDEEEYDKTLLTATTTVLVKTVFQALLHEVYGASEMELLVACLIQQGAHTLLNAVLMGVVKEYDALFTTQDDGLCGAHLGLGSPHATTNFVAFVFLIEDVLFYSTSTHNAEATARPTESQRRRGYTEEYEMVLCPSRHNTREHRQQQHQRKQQQQEEEEEEEKGSNDTPGADLFFWDEAMQYCIAPDGVWFHMSLALDTMHLITKHVAVLNFDGASATNGGSSSNTPASGVDVYTRERRGRKGGFRRFFVRLFRVVCKFTLRDVSQVNGILVVSKRWVVSVPKEQGIFLLLRRQGAEQREHSPFSGSMIMILSLHELLLRRLRFSVQGPSAQFADANNNILDRIRSLCVLHKRSLHQMQIFHLDNSSDRSASPTRRNTLDWLCCKNRENSIADFVEVASRQDYDSFIRQCTLIMERDQLTEKGMVWQITMEYRKNISQLHQTIVNLSLSRKAVLDVLEQHFQATAAEKGANSALKERYGPHAARTVATEMFNSVWTRFLERCKGTIWDLDPAGQRSTKYVRLLELEQHQLIRRKFFFDSNGTDHADITPMGSGGLVVDPPAGKPHLRLRGGEHVLLGSSDSDSEDEEEENDDEEKEHGGGGATLPELIKSKQDVHFSVACEVPYMMHCWSATFMIRGGDICVFFDDENKSYNQRITEETRSLLIKPSSIIYPSAHVVMLAPGRRFRMKRTAVELWFFDGRSVFINFFANYDMRTAAKNIRDVANRQRASHNMPFCVLHENPKKESLLLQHMEQWRDREISNFEYLLWLNLLAGRTLNDLTQYPIFPWVISDYTSEELDLEKSSTFRDFTLPVGICGGPSFCARVKRRYEETKQIGDVPAHYFTHYSSCAVVLYYLLRVEPFTTLHIILQGGHLDHPDRMFHSMASCWHGVTTNSQDVRELIPELFYMPELCMNTNQVRFGCKQEGTPVDSLELPPWAHDDPYEFVYRMREALECDYVSSMLHHWIDLIFGYKQRGKEAIAALNVFNWHSYEELDKNLRDDVDQQLLIDSLDNIGQTPIQLFTRNHVERRVQNFADPVACSLNIKTVDICPMRFRMARLAVLSSDRVLVVCATGAALLFKLCISPVMRRAHCVLKTDSPDSHVDTSTASTAAVSGGDGTKLTATTITTTSTTTTPMTRVMAPGGVFLPTPLGRGFSGGGTRGRPSVDMLEGFERRTGPLLPGVVPNTSNTAGGPCETENVAVLCLENEVFVAFGGLFNNTFMIIPLNPAFSEERQGTHRGRVVCITASSDSRYLVTGAEDTTFILWSCHLQHNPCRLYVHLLFTVYGHEDNPTAVDLSPALDLVATASRDGVLMLHSLMSGRLERSLRHPKKFSIDRVLIQSTCYMPNILYASAVDHVIHQISTNGVELRSLPAPGRITSWCVTPRQYILVTTTPPTKSNTSAGNDGTVLFIHAFYLSILKSVSCSLQGSGGLLTCCGVHPLNPQVILCGSSKGSLLLLRIESQE